MVIGYKNNTGVYIENKYFIPMKNSFECKNLQKISKKDLGFYGWQNLPDIITHYKPGATYTKIPLGYYGFRPDQIENRTNKFRRIEFPKINGVLSNEQVAAISSLMKQLTGLLHASTGVGKTWMIAGITLSVSKKTLIVCDAIGRMTQMQDDLYQILGVKYQSLSGTKTKKNSLLNDDIVVGNIDSIIKMPREWLDQFGLILLDECDRYLQSDNRREWIGSLSPDNLYGLTGTIKLNHVDGKVFPIYLGPKTEFLVKNFTPTIHQVHTEFEYSGFQDTDIDTEEFHIKKFDMKDFHLLKSELYTDEGRNNLIVRTILETVKGRKAICFTEHIEHAKLLQLKLEEWGLKTFLIIGEVSGEDREMIRSAITEYKGSCILIGSKACIGRGLNIPELSVGYLTISEKFHSSIDQFVGRIIRKFPGKDNNTIDWYDFVDDGVGILSNQAAARTSVYRREFPKCKFVQHFVDDKDPLSF